MIFFKQVGKGHVDEEFERVFGNRKDEEDNDETEEEEENDKS